MNRRDAEKEGLLIRGRNLAVEKAVSRARFVRYDFDFLALSLSLEAAFSKSSFQFGASL